MIDTQNAKKLVDISCHGLRIFDVSLLHFLPYSWNISVQAQRFNIRSFKIALHSSDCDCLRLLRFQLVTHSQLYHF